MSISRESTVPPATSEQGARERKFAGVVAEHIPLLRRRARGYRSDPHAAEELVQETLLRAWRNIDRLRADVAARAWLLRILEREHARAWARRPAPPADVDPELLPDPAGPATVVTVSVRRALADLPECFREPFLRHVVGDAPLAEIASDLGVKRATVKTRVFRARRRLRARLAAQG